MTTTETRFRRAVLTVAALNLGYFGIEAWAAVSIQSVSLMADAVDFLEDASVNLLIFLAMGWGLASRARLGKGLAVLMALPALAFAWVLVQKMTAPELPDAFSLSAIGAGALMVNVGCAFLLARFRQVQGSLAKAAFLSARNDAIANAGIIAAGLVTRFAPSIWPDVIVGLGIAWMNLDAARAVWHAAQTDALAARS